MIKAGLVTVLFNADDVLDDFFKSLSIQSFKNYVLYIIDNSPSAATDKLIAHLSRRYQISNYIHIKNPENYGVAKGNNQGIELALRDGADYVILLNNDIAFVQPLLLEQLISTAVKKGEDIIIPKIYYYGTRKLWMAGGAFIHYKGTSATIGDKEEDNGQYNADRYVDYAPTCFMLCSKKVFDVAGLMDERYFVYYDDNDFVFRAKKRGFSIYYLHALEVFHKVSISTGGAESLFSIYYLNRNRILFIRKHYKFPLKQIALMHMMLTKGIRHFSYDKARKKQLIKAVKDGFSISVN
ncbi:glycosyltransferase family 2 protein [Mucilaginibacter calamicampi]|uniref:Glycosyltransferase family 2 protein n=1 Tax=Mucilaginibacter calamicampi TaxID=1302352 RepID=A0ABW2YYU1_9SPHI